MTFAAYTLAIVLELTAHLSRIAALPSHLLAGHVANFQFWVDEVAHGLAVLEGYDERYQRMLDAQRVSLEGELHQEARPTQPLIPPRLVPRPGRLAQPMRNYVRSELCHAFRSFALSAHRSAYLDAEAVRSACQRLLIHIDDSELN